ncbi:MAG: LysR family transcriptional regulator [Rhodospirillaceae bacterium]|jgi:DNA-binding transcriptional LysR family regulator|uniref:LysR family transcriptional regulator n=1 Tax=Hwanghaeella sp. 1Z406 TaxID=3402811 RepID=UPI000C53E45E|nr:LysR family transcriptional regulator [Rhodospirillales bacterium]MAX49139.1 LysR family transcriptional regulator [Rhodospirillaceae bacterium]|tara:strand:+ start:23078 stop:23995 length:918 start_codon:yes stop_codon:yes gene_type:complete
MIKLEALRVFVTVAELGNIRDASDRLGRTASAISMTLKQLEEELGNPLFESDRKNSLTALGQFTLETGREQIQSYDKSIRMIQDFAHDKIGHLALASVPSVAANLIPLLLPRFINERPGITVELFDLDSRNVCAMVESGQADLGIASTPKASAPVAFTPLFRDRFKVICNAESDLTAITGPLQWHNLQDQALIKNGSSDAIMAPQFLQLTEKSTMVVRNVTSLFALAKAGVGITLLPALTTLNLPEGICALDLADTSAERIVGLLERKSGFLSPVSSSFKAFLRMNLKTLASALSPHRQESFVIV